MAIYLDTHAACWLYTGALEKFSPRALEEIEQNSLLISPMVGLELQFLFEIKRLKVQATEILNVLRRDFHIQECPAEFVLVSHRARSLQWTRDPFDRIITAQAALFDAPLLTKDRNIRSNYPQAVWE